MGIVLVMANRKKQQNQAAGAMGLVASGKGTHQGVCGSWKRNGACPKIDDCPNLHPDDQKGKGKGKKGKAKGKGKEKGKKKGKEDREGKGNKWSTVSDYELGWAEKDKRSQSPKGKGKGKKGKGKGKAKSRVKAKRGR